MDKIYVLAASWAISVYYAYQRTWKPFNPILGETYELTNHGGIRFISEQVSCEKYNSPAFRSFLVMLYKINVFIL